MKQVIAQEKAWEMIRGAKSAGGQIVSASIHVRITENTNASDFQKTVSAILSDGFTQPRGRAVIVWGDAENESTETPGGGWVTVIVRLRDTGPLCPCAVNV